MSVNANLTLKCEATETDDLGVALASAPSFPWQLQQVASLGATSTPVATKVWRATGQLTAGAATIDLTALARGSLPAVDLTGLKVQVVMIRNLSTNTGELRIDTGAASGYNVLGAAASEATIAAGGALAFYSPEGLPDVAAGAKNIDLSSAADPDLTYEIIVVAG